MTGPPAETAAVRAAVRAVLSDGPVAAAVSGGADSLALAAALAFERPGADALVVDHGLLPGSAEVARRAAEQCASLGLQPRVLRVHVSGGNGPEAAARDARYAALDAFEGLVLLGHTLDDQAEQVLLGLARGAGARSLGGMPAARGRFRRPLLGLPRDVVRRACAQAGLEPWEDPSNADARHARARVRAEVLPVVEQCLGPGAAAALARSAAQLREDAEALDDWAARVETDDVAELLALPGAVRARVLKRLAERACGRSVTAAHVGALRALVEDWRGQGPVSLPGGVRMGRAGGRLRTR